MPDRHPWHFPAATFGLGAAALAGIIIATPSAAAPAGQNTETAAHAMVAVSQDAPINLLAARTSCTSVTTTVMCAY